MIEKAEVIEATEEEFLEMTKSEEFVTIEHYPIPFKYLDYEIGFYKGKRVIFDPFVQRNEG